MQAADFWNDALTYDDYVKDMNENQDAFRRNFKNTTITAAVRDAFGAKPLRFLVLTEDFCGDSAQFIPPVGKLAHEVETIDIRILHRDQHPEFAAGYQRDDGYQAIPVFILLNAEGNELGYLIERPKQVNEEMAAETLRFAREHSELDGINRNYNRMPEATHNIVKEHNLSWRTQNQEQWTEILFDSLAGLLKRSPAKAPTNA